ncbi:MAG TPA: glycosyltransferase family 4 protein [Nostocaceae cyanobacterium]|nr:glycosyltransferase family 4 protein [Nostocaceae cyanobacterium]
MKTTKSQIVIFDFNVTKNSPIGSCVLQLVTDIYKDYQITVVADIFENPAPEEINWIRVPLPPKPVLLRYVLFQWLAPIYYRKYYRNNSGKKPLIIASQGEFINCDISYSQFGHQAYLDNQWHTNTSKGLRRLARWMIHKFNANTEAKAFAHTQKIVVPSQGLAKELTETYPQIANKIVIIPNPVDIHKFAPPQEFNRQEMRKKFNFSANDVVMIFVALGDFERKGLNLLMESLAKLENPQAKLLVVGGTESIIQEYKQLQNQLGLANQVYFAGFQTDIRPYLWASDLLVHPSTYETFCLVVFQGCAAGLPFMATQLYGVEEFLQNGINGWQVERNLDSISTTLQQILGNKTKVIEMGKIARNMVNSYDAPIFVSRWRSIIQKLVSV